MTPRPENKNVAKADLAIDQRTALGHVERMQQSILLREHQASSISDVSPHAMAYSPYGHFANPNKTALPAFNGQWLDPVTQGYALGNGYRVYKTNLMRFASPDSFSPFDRGGLNAYAYCQGDPINKVDNSGHISHFFRSFLKGVKNRLGLRKSPNKHSQTNGIDYKYLAPDIPGFGRLGKGARASNASHLTEPTASHSVGGKILDSPPPILSHNPNMAPTQSPTSSRRGSNLSTRSVQSSVDPLNPFGMSESDLAEVMEAVGEWLGAPSPSLTSLELEFLQSMQSMQKQIRG